MGFKITENESTDRWVESEEILWLTADRERLVADGDPEAASLFTTPGKRISREDAEKYGLVKAKGKPETKEAAPEEDKQAKPAEDKQQKLSPRAAKAGPAKRAG